MKNVDESSFLLHSIKALVSNSNKWSIKLPWWLGFLFQVTGEMSPTDIEEKCVSSGNFRKQNGIVWDSFKRLHNISDFNEDLELWFDDGPNSKFWTIESKLSGDMKTLWELSTVLQELINLLENLFDSEENWRRYGSITDSLVSFEIQSRWRQIF